MKKHYFLKKTFTFCFLLCLTIAYSQTEQQRKQITKSYDFKKLKDLESSFQKNFFSEKLKATKIANENNWPIRYTNDEGTLFELKKIANDGSPIYYQTFNTAAAESTRADWMHSGGGLGLNIEGQGMTAHVWDGGLARSTHQEYDGAGGTDRHSIGDGTTALHFHAAHVTGTIMASGVVANSKGMAPQSSVIGYDWTNDIAEATIAAANGMLLSNHSYGFGASAIPDWYFGAYISDSRDWDVLMYNSPYYLMVVAAGNDGGDNTSNADPLNGNAAYDKLSSHATSKNNLVVANGQDATINGDGTLNFVVRNTGSSEGPTDDLRIKPDIMGNGTNLYSTYQNSDTAYNSITGTSMASPNVCGSLLLLQQYYNTTNGVFMKAATVKGLTLHTADDTAANGPDAQTGWGLMNTKVAAETISNNGLGSWISEEELSQGETFTMTVQSDGVNPLLASISWTDQAGTANTGTPNDATAILVNDLDVKVTQGGFTGEAWKLTDVNTNSTGDNTVDPYERVDVAVASGTYTITVTHKGVLAGGPQNFSLILTGLSSDFTINTANSSQTVCSSTDAVYTFNYEKVGGPTTNITTTGEPAGMTTNITPNSLNANGTFDVTFGNLTALAADTYDINVIGGNGSEVEVKIISLRVLHADFSGYPQTIVSPTNGLSNMATTVQLTWLENINAESYYVEVATDPAFNTIFSTSTETNTTVTLSSLPTETVYYWRVRPDNSCSNGIFSPVYSFQTGGSNCSNVFTGTDLTNAAIGATAGDWGEIPINVTGGLIINSMTVTTDITHTYIEDLTVYLRDTPALGANYSNLITEPCGDDDDINNTTFDDTAPVFTCNPGIPAISGTISPEQPLASKIGLNADGIWIVDATDGYDGDSGQINSASITICSLEVITNIPNLVNNGLDVDTNSTYTTLVGDIEATTAAETDTQQVYTLIELPTKGDLKNNGTTMVIGDTFTQNDVNTGKITFVNIETVDFVDQFKVDVQNSVNGWLPNQIVIINGSTLGVNEFELGSLEIWPNPTSGKVNIKINTATGNDIQVNLFDIQGRKVFNNLFESNFEVFNTSIELGNIANGVYLLDVQQGNKKTTKRIIINN